jgi:phospholipid/cholesterol/gamma-HCH transport system substrate-binding protein
VVLAALTFAFSGWKSSSKGRTLMIDYPDITGIRRHSAVRYAGAPAGTVVEVRLLTDEERKASEGAAVRVMIKLDENIPPLPDDIEASLASDTLLSEKFVSLSPGSPDRPKLPDGALLRSAGPSGLDALIDNVGPLVKSVDSLVEQLGNTLKGFDTVVEKTGGAVDTFHNGIADALPRVSKLADSLKGASDSANEAVQRIDKLVEDVDPLVKEDLRKLNESLDELRGALTSAGKLMTNTDKQVTGRMQELSVVLQNLKVASTHAKALAKSLGEKPSRIIFSGRPKQLPSEEVILRSSRPIPIR